MKKECKEYAQRVAEEIEAIYNGTTEEENDDGEKMSLMTMWQTRLIFLLSCPVKKQFSLSAYTLRWAAPLATLTRSCTRLFAPGAEIGQSMRLTGTLAMNSKTLSLSIWKWKDKHFLRGFLGRFP